MNRASTNGSAVCMAELAGYAQREDVREECFIAVPAIRAKPAPRNFSLFRSSTREPVSWGRRPGAMAGGNWRERSFERQSSLPRSPPGYLCSLLSLSQGACLLLGRVGGGAACA